MADRPTQVPEWATGEGADIVEPPAGKKEQGWVQEEKPPAGYFNWLFALLTAWVAWFADKLHARAGFGIDVPEGIATTRIEVDRGADATGPGVQARGRGGTAPGGRFFGSSPLRAEATEGTSAAVVAEVTATSTGPAFQAVYNRAGAPARGMFSIDPTAEPTAPVTGDIYFDELKHRLMLRHANQWAPFGFSANETRRRVLGTPNNPALGADWTAPYGDVSFYFDGRRVWLDGRVARATGSNPVIFTLPVECRPIQETWLPALTVGAIAEVVNLMVGTDGQVSVPPGSGTYSALSLSGLSFEVAS